MRFSQTLTLTAAAVVVGCVAGADPQTFTLDDCKSALSSLKEKPYSSSLPSMAASTGKFCLWKKRGGGTTSECERVCICMCRSMHLVPLAGLVLLGIKPLVRVRLLPYVSSGGGREGRA